MSSAQRLSPGSAVDLQEPLEILHKNNFIFGAAVVQIVAPNYFSASLTKEIAKNTCILVYNVLQ